MRKTKNAILKTLLGLVGLFIVCICLFPLFWMVLTTFKTSRELFSFSFWPKSLDFSNWGLLFEAEGLLQSLKISFIAAAMAVAGSFVNVLSGYAFARIDFKGKKFFWGYCLVPMFVPGIATMIPCFMVVLRLGLLNTIPGLVIAGFAASGVMFYMRQYFLNIPMSLEEAAIIDGCNYIQSLFKVFIPNAIPAIVIVTTGAFMGCWNAYLWPVLTISDENLYPITLFMRFFKSERGTTNYGLIMAGGCLAAMPPIIVFLIFQKYIVQGVKMSGLKG